MKSFTLACTLSVCALFLQSSGSLKAEERVVLPPIGQVAFSESGRYVAAVAEQIYIFDLVGYRLSRKIKVAPFHRSHMLKFYGNDEYIIIGYTRGLDVWKIDNGELVLHLEAGPVLGFDIYKNLVLTGNYQGTLMLWDLDTGRKIWERKRRFPNLHNVFFFNNGKKAITGGDDGNLTIWDIARKEIEVVIGVDEFAFSSGDISKDESLFISNGSGSLLYLWNIDKTTPVKTFKEQSSHDGCLKFIPNSRLFVSCGYRWVYIWSLDAEDPLKKLEGHRQVVSSLDVSPDGSLIVSGSWDRTVRIWATKSGKELFVFGFPEEEPPGEVPPFAGMGIALLVFATTVLMAIAVAFYAGIRIVRKYRK
ncbi:MAG: hypothetical protein F9K24_01070 [Leptonema illini]|uniref:WD40 repeat domain-containing protein n=1 Tax=Leptonema illini TaxID=183 RepID=A0A833H549_9LEPT|nr:MAG: hypothetical protein F9K24_01070 [Leptonema illini]